MPDSKLSKCSSAFGLSLGLASVVNALLVIAKEKSPSVLNGMKTLTGHHWVTHCVIVVGLFLATGGLLTKVNGGQGVKPTIQKLLGAVAGGVVLGGLIIVGFYLFAD